MKLGEWAALAEIIGGLGIIASLLFVGTEIQQNTAAIRTATVQAIAEHDTSINLVFATDDKLADLFLLTFVDDEAHRDQAKMPEADRIRLEMAIRSALRRVENIFLHVETGVLEPEALDRVGFGWYQTTFVRDYWRTARTGFDDDFALFMDERIQEELEPPQQ